MKLRPFPRPSPLRSLWRAAGLALLISAAWTAHAAPDPKAARFYEDALARYEKKDYKGSVIQLKNALQIEKESLQVQLLLGRALLADNQPGQAEIALSEALRLGVNRAEVIVDLAQSLADQGKQPTLLTDPRFVTTGLPNLVQARLTLLKGSAASDIGNIREAYRLIEQARALNPSSPDSWIAESTLRVRERRFDQAITAVDRAIALGGESAPALYQRGQIDHAAGRLPAALATYGRALKLDPTHVETLLARAGLLIDLGKFDEAQRDVAEVRRVQPEDPRGAFLAALLAEKTGDTPAVRAALKTVTALVDPVPMDYIKYKSQILMLNGLAHYGLGERENAKPYLEAYQKLDPAGGVSKLLARIQLSEGNIDAAISALESYLRAHPTDAQAQALLSSAHMAQGRANRAVSIAREALKQTESPELRTVLGLGMLRTGQTNDALAELEGVYRRDPAQTNAAATLAGLYLQRGEPRKALTVAEQLVKRVPKSAAFTTLLGQARLAAGDKAGARKAFGEASQLDPAMIGPQIELARMDSQDGALPAAEQRLTALLGKNERNTEIQFQLASVAERQGKLADAQKWLEKAVDLAGPREHRPAIALVDFHMRYKRPTEALVVAKALVSKMPSELQPQLTLARVLLAQADREGAKAALGTATRLANFDPRLQVEIGVLQMMAGNLTGAAYSLDKALTAQPDHLPALAAMVDVEIRQGDLVKAEARARGIAQAHPKRAVGHSLIGEVAWARGAVNPAIDAFQRAHQIEPSTDTMIRLQNALRRRDGAKAAIALGEQWIKSRPQDARARLAQAGLLARSGQFPQARTQYEWLLQKSPRDPVVLNDLANVLLQIDPAAAVPVAERAVAAAPGDAGVIDTLGWALLRNGQNERALQMLRDARLRKPDEPTIRYHLAEALVKVGRPAEAKAELQAALAAAPRFEGYKQAQTLLQSLP